MTTVFKTHQKPIPKVLFGIGAITILSYTAPSLAQSNDDESEELEPIEEIVVTVERREQSLQDVAGTAASFDGEDLKLLGVQNINDLDGSLPGLSIANNAGNIEVYIRGVGSSNNTELGDPAAATHLDGTYIPRPAGFGAAFFDIQRVEVNIGPQGTLRGRNATAGSINVIPFKPGIGLFNAMAEVTLGDYNEQRYEGMVNLPIGSNSALRIAGFVMEHDSYYNIMNPPAAGAEGVATSESEGLVGGEAADDSGVRLSYLMEDVGGVDDLRLSLTFDSITQKGTGYTGTNYASVLAAGIDPETVNPRDVYVRPITPREDTEHSGFRFQLDYATDAFNIEYSLSQRDLVYDYRWGGAADTAAFPGVLEESLVDGNRQEEFNFDNFSRIGLVTDSLSNINEVRLFSDTQPLQWTAGMFLFDEAQKTFLGGTGDNNVYFYGNEFNQRTNTESLSFYGDATYWYTDKLRFTGGLRFTSDEKKRTGINIRYNRFVGLGHIWWGNWGGAPRAGTPGFEFSGLARSHLVPDTNGDSMLSTQEITQFYMDGVASFGNRDTIGAYAAYLQTLFDGLNELGASGIGGGTDGGVANGEYNAPLSGDEGTLLRPSCETINTLVVGFPCTDGSDGGPAGHISYLFANASVFAFQNGSLENDFVDWRMRAEYDASDDNLLYGLIATGHKSGGFNDNLPNVSVMLNEETEVPTVEVTFNGDGPVPTYDEESVMLFEFGSKNVFDLGDMRLTFNASVFSSDYQNLQITNLVSNAQILDFAALGYSPAGELEDRTAIADANAADNIVAFTFNAANAAISGAQIDGSLRFPSNLKLSYNLLLLSQADIQDSVEVQDSRFSPEAQYDNCFPRDSDGKLLPSDEVCNARLQSIEGHRLPRTPEMQFNFSVSKPFVLGNGYIDVIASAGYRSEQHMTIFNGKVYNDDLSDLEKLRIADLVEGYWTYDAGMGYSLTQGWGELRIEGYINNLTDEQKAQAIIITQRDNTRFFSRPRTLGFRARAIF